MISFYLTNGDSKIKIETSHLNGSKFKAFFHLIQRNLPQTAQSDSPKHKQPKLEAHDFSAQTDSFQIPSTSPDLSPQLNALNQKLVSLQEQIFQLHQTQHPPSWADIASRTPSPQLKTIMINRYDSTLIFDNVPIQHDSTEHFVQLINETLATNAILPPITSSEVTSILKLQKPLAWTVSFSTVNLAKAVLASSKHFRSPSRTHRIFISPMLSPQQQQKMEDLVSKCKLLRKKISERTYDFRVYQCGLAVKIVSANSNKVSTRQALKPPHVTLSRAQSTKQASEHSLVKPESILYILVSILVHILLLVVSPSSRQPIPRSLPMDAPELSRPDLQK